MKENKRNVADLYIRVSTVEQMKTGCSKLSQEDFLRRYCKLNEVQIRHVIFEDHFARSSKRPGWKAYLLDLKRNIGEIDFLIFLDWDHFSRNASEAYPMISALRDLGVEPQAVVQPLDLEIWESKMRLSFHGKGV